jgi:hypothetical protein
MALTPGAGSSNGTGLQTQMRVGQVASVEGDVQGRQSVRTHVEDGTREPIGRRHMSHGARCGEDSFPDPPPLIKDRIPRGVRKSP